MLEGLIAPISDSVSVASYNFLGYNNIIYGIDSIKTVALNIPKTDAVNSDEDALTFH